MFWVSPRKSFFDCNSVNFCPILMKNIAFESAHKGGLYEYNHDPGTINLNFRLKGAWDFPNFGKFSKPSHDYTFLNRLDLLILMISFSSRFDQN